MQSILLWLIPLFPALAALVMGLLPLKDNSRGTHLAAAAALAVKDMGLEVYFANRSSHAAAPFAQKIGVEYVPLDKIPLLLPQTDIIVYNLSMEIEPLRGVSLQGKIVFEANYAHPNLAHRDAGLYIDGRYWLYNQAIPAFRLFAGEEPLTAPMKEVMGL